MSKQAQFNYGGQAVIEGVMMRGQRNMAVAVRDPNGEIVIHSEPLESWIHTSPITKWPFVRGLVMLWDTMALGIRTLMFSADVALGEEDIEFSGPIAWGTIIVSFAIGIGIFFLLPSVLAKLVERWVSSPLLSSLIEGLIRIALFIAYIALIGLVPDIRRVFAYHGSEHKTINALEDGQPLTPESVRRYTTAHTRCGTSFLLIVLVISIILFAPFHFEQWSLRLLSRIILIPVIAGLSYEYLKFSANHQDNGIVRAITKPGLMLQRLTTREPDDSMLEVAIASLKKTLSADDVTDIPGLAEETHPDGDRLKGRNMYTVPYSRETLEFEVPDDMEATVLKSKVMQPVDDPHQATSDALASPIDSPALSKLVKPGDKVCLVFTDVTRACPDYLLVPPILHELETAGVRDEDITLLCGIGLHRPSTPEERIEKLGQAVVDRYRIIDSAPCDPEQLVDLGTTPSGVPLSVNRTAYEADLLIATGIVEPHQYAGYSGGRKTIAVGGAGERMIEYTHGPDMIDHPGTRLGKLEGNPFHEAITEAAKRAGLRFILNVVMDDDKNIIAVKAGEPEATHNALVVIAKQLFEVPISHQYDVAVAGVGYPKDANLYQASRAASYLFFAPTPVVRTGGYIIIPARAEEGAGEGVGEQRYYEAMRDAPDMQSILDDARTHGYKPGGQRAFVMAKVQEACDIIIVGSECPDIVRDLHAIPATTMEEAFAIVQEDLGRELQVAIVPHALLTLPIIEIP